MIPVIITLGYLSSSLDMIGMFFVNSEPIPYFRYYYTLPITVNDILKSY